MTKRDMYRLIVTPETVRDVTRVNIVRHMFDGVQWSTQYATTEWHDCAPGDALEPALVVPGQAGFTISTSRLVETFDVHAGRAL